MSSNLASRESGPSTIRFFSIEHDTPFTAYPLDEIREEIQEDDSKLVTEYFLPELNQTVFKTLYRGLKEEDYPDGAGIVRFGRAVNQIAQKEHRNVLTLDPANSFWFEFLFQFLPIGLVIGGYAGLTFFLEKPKVSDPHLPSRSLSRRDFVKYSSLIAAAIGAETISWRLQDAPVSVPPEFYRDYSFNLEDMRWTTIARGLRQYCQTSPSENLLVLYPNAHIKGILHYWDHPESGNFKYNFYKRIPGLTREIREYTWSKNGWTLVQKPRPIY